MILKKDKMLARLRDVQGSDMVHEMICIKRYTGKRLYKCLLIKLSIKPTIRTNRERQTRARYIKLLFFKVHLRSISSFTFPFLLHNHFVFQNILSISAPILRSTCFVVFIHFLAWTQLHNHIPYLSSLNFQQN